MMTPEYNVLLNITCQLFSVLKLDASRLKALPIGLQPATIQHQLNHYWFPTLISCFGSLEHFLFYFVITPTGKEMLQTIIQSGVIDDNI